MESTLKERLGDNEFHKMYIRLSDFAAVNREEDEDNVIYKKITDSIERILGSKRNIERLIDKHFVLGENSMKICAYIGLDFKSTKIENERNN